MTLSNLLSLMFEKIPEHWFKNRLRYFLAFNKFVPSFIQDISPIKGYELHRKLKKGDIVIDAGAYTGDYTVYAAKKVGKNGKIYAFEPDSKNREILKANLKHEKLNNVIIIPKGLWSSNTNLSFEDKGRLNSNFLSNGKTIIPVVKLDEELKKYKIKHLDFIKMDIEGSEIEAIKGCEKTLKKYSPDIAIASYHVVEGKETSIFLEAFLKKIGYNVKTDFLKHKTTYASMPYKKSVYIGQSS